MHDWDGQHFPLWPAAANAAKSGILIQSAYYAYILLDMATIERHNERSFDIACIENYWLSDNFPDPSRIRVIGDSDEAMIVMWTPSAIYTAANSIVAVSEFRPFRLLEGLSVALHA